MANHKRLGAMALLAVSAAVIAAASPRALAPAAGGLWAVSADATGHDAEQICVSSPKVLALWEHRAGRCTPEVISDQGTVARIRYTCTDGGFGDTKITLITPVVEVDGRDRMVDVYNWHLANPKSNWPPLVYWGRYVAHDNNRDAIGLSLKLTRNVLNTYLTWKPQVLHD